MADVTSREPLSSREPLAVSSGLRSAIFPPLWHTSRAPVSRKPVSYQFVGIARRIPSDRRLPAGPGRRCGRQVLPEKGYNSRRKDTARVASIATILAFGQRNPRRPAAATPIPCPPLPPFDRRCLPSSLWRPHRRTSYTEVRDKPPSRRPSPWPIMAGIVSRVPRPFMARIPLPTRGEGPKGEAPRTFPTAERDADPGAAKRPESPDARMSAPPRTGPENTRETPETARTDTEMSAQCPLSRPVYLRPFAANAQFKRRPSRKIRARDT